MEFSIKSGKPENLRADCVAIGVFAGGKKQPVLTTTGKALDRATRGEIQAVLDKGDFSGKTGSCQFLYKLPGIPCERVLLFGLGKEDEATQAGFIKSIRAAVKAIAATKAEDALIALDADAPVKIRLATLAAADELAGKNGPPKKEKATALKKLAFWRADDGKTKRDAGAEEKALREGEAIAAGLKLARTLGDLPANQCTPAYLADAAGKLAKRHKIRCEILDAKAIRAAGMNALLAVAQGSRQQPRFIVLEYKGSNRKTAGKPLVLVGKGITFDSGGISLKPPANMDEMKFDMCGAASVLGVMEAAARLRLPLHLVALIPACENMPDGEAIRPGDVITTLSGQTVEILNTDAEGRLILCDALAYAKRFDPAVIVDVATLTGACAVALGRVAHGLFANDDALSAALIQAGEAVEDKAWRLPLWEDYQEGLESQFADMSNVGGREGGAITAACFLSRFVDKKTPWAHLDIAGTAWKSGREKSATGRPVALLSQYLLTLAAGKPA
ncbi:MAG: leucyl aminopeptidase [Zoogloeaceae bacterium]|nr:leucyl aminopeptidase [Zoogloeaceae bacterium]